MLRVWMILLGLLGMTLAAAQAELYRWTDNTGKTHLTDNPDAIPPAYRSQAPPPEAPATPPSEAPATASPVPAPQPVPVPSSTPRASPLPATTPEAAPPLATRLADLQEQIRTARQERQTYFDRLRSERVVHTTPEFVRQRRQIADMSRALFTVEQRLDTLQTALAEAQRQQREAQIPPIQPSDTGFDQQGHDAAYWQRLIAAPRDRLQQAQAQRRTLLMQLTVAATNDESRNMERHGRDILQQAHTLEQLASEIDTAEAALENLRQAARQAGASDSWLE